MGHSRLSHIPRTIYWKKVIGALSGSDSSLAEIIALTAKAERRSKLRKLVLV